MKKSFFIYLLLFLSFVACDIKNRAPEDADEQKTLIEVQRYDRLQSRYLTTGDFSALQQMSTGYPMETRILIEDILEIGQVDDADINHKFLNFFQDTIAQSLITEAETQYAKMDEINNQLTEAFHQLNKWIPDLQIPMFYAQISALRQSIIVSDEAVGISLDKYLGENYPLYYQYYSEEQRASMKRDNILPDCLSFYLISRFPLKDFATRSQHERDIHMAKIQWLVNKSIGRPFFKTTYVKKIDKYMKEHNHTAIDKFLRDTVYSKFY